MGYFIILSIIGGFVLLIIFLSVMDNIMRKKDIIRKIEKSPYMKLGKE
jgi:hypothetical protein